MIESYKNAPTELAADDDVIAHLDLEEEGGEEEERVDDPEALKSCETMTLISS